MLPRSTAAVLLLAALITCSATNTRGGSSSSAAPSDPKPEEHSSGNSIGIGSTSTSRPSALPTTAHGAPAVHARDGAAAAHTIEEDKHAQHGAGHSVQHHASEGMGEGKSSMATSSEGGEGGESGEGGVLTATSHKRRLAAQSQITKQDVKTDILKELKKRRKRARRPHVPHEPFEPPSEPPPSPAPPPEPPLPPSPTPPPSPPPSPPQPPSPSPPPPPAGPPYEDPAAILLSRPDLSIMRRAVAALPGMATSLHNRHMMTTFFVPTDQAFAESLGAAGMSAEDLLSDTLSLKSLLLYHMLDTERRTVESLEEGEELVMYSTHRIKVAVAAAEGGSGTSHDAPSIADLLLVDEVGQEAGFVETDIVCGKSLVHLIDRVLVPQFSSISELLMHNPLGLFGATGMAVERSTEGDRYSDSSLPLVLLSPTEDAWAALATARRQSVGVMLSRHDLVDRLLKNHTFMWDEHGAGAPGSSAAAVSSSPVAEDPDWMSGPLPREAKALGGARLTVRKDASTGKTVVEANGVRAHLVHEGCLTGVGRWRVCAVDAVMEGSVVQVQAAGGVTLQLSYNGEE